MHTASTTRPQSAARTRPLTAVYAAEALSSAGASLLMTGIFFYTARVFGWGALGNLLLAAGQGVAYTAGALLASPLSAALGRRRALLLLYGLMAAVALLAWAAAAPLAVVALLIAYDLLSAASWPILESLITSDATAEQISRRTSAYNLVWASVNGVGFAASGSIIEYWPAGMFLVPAVMHVACVAVMLAAPSDSAAADGHAHVDPEPELLRKRTLALWLARIAMPATYVVTFSLMAMMPLLPVVKALDPAAQTLAASAWMAARWLTFIALGVTTWWHSRPLLLLASAAVMLVAFLGVAVPPSQVFGAHWIGHSVDLASMVGWQVALGAVVGTIYAASLYYGMALSRGSTEHGGYHEALIGVGSALGPGVAALTQWARPGDLTAGVVAVAGMVAVTVAGAAVVAVRLRPPPRANVDTDSVVPDTPPTSPSRV